MRVWFRKFLRAITRPPFVSKYRKGERVWVSGLKGTISKVEYKEGRYWYHIKELGIDFPQSKVKRRV